jgi:hypothetical protein
VWKRLGKPDAVDGYKFEGVNGADGKPLGEDMQAAIRKTADELNLSVDGAATLAKAIVKFNSDTAAAEQGEKAAKLQAETAELQKNWGANMDANKFIARQAAEKLGVAPEAVAALEGQIGYAAVMEMFRNIGTKIGEDRFVNTTVPGSNGVMTRDQAVARKAELMADTEWAKAYLNGDSAKAREMTALNVLITG